MTAADRTRAFYTDPAFTALRCVRILREDTAVDALSDFRRRLALAGNLAGRFGIDGPAPDAVRAVLSNFVAALTPIEVLNRKLKSAGAASDERANLLEDADPADD